MSVGPEEMQRMLIQWMNKYHGLLVCKIHLCNVPVRDRADVLQEVLITTWHALERGEIIRDPCAWMMECAWNHARNYRRKNLRHVVLRLENAAVESSERALEARQELRLALQSLDTTLQEIVVKVFCDGIEWEQMAEAHGAKKDHVIYLLRLARNKMRIALQREEVMVNRRRTVGFPLQLAYFSASPRSYRQVSSHFSPLEASTDAGSSPIQEEAEHSTSLNGTKCSVQR